MESNDKAYVGFYKRFDKFNKVRTRHKGGVGYDKPSTAKQNISSLITAEEYRVVEYSLVPTGKVFVKKLGEWTETTLDVISTT